MTISISGTTLTFNDATTQTTAGLVSGGALGTPSSGALTNCTSVPVNQATGTLPVANGGSGAATLAANNVLLGNGTSALQAVAPSTNGNYLRSNGTTWVSQAGATGTVTSVATGNGLSGGTITSSGTLVVACPTYNTVGSYVFTKYFRNSADISGGSNFSAGSGNNQFQATCYRETEQVWNVTNNLSGTWKWMAADSVNDSQIIGIICRVS
jgi:hypothetical protein